MKFSLLIANIIILPVFMIGPSFAAFHPQEAKVNQRKIEKEQKRKAREGAKHYEQAKKDHYSRQSKETRAMMKSSKKESKKNTPMNPPGGKKCK